MSAIGVISDNKHSFFILDMSPIFWQYLRLVNGLLWFFTGGGAADIYPPKRAPLSCRFFIRGEPPNKTAAPWRGFSTL